MIVKITNYDDNRKDIEYSVSCLESNQIEYLKNNLDEEIIINSDVLIIKMHFEDDFYPLQSDIAKIKRDDFIAREEIEMNAFLSSYLEDM